MDQYSCAALFTRVDNICKKLYLKIVPKKKRSISTKPMVVHSDTLCQILLHPDEGASLFNHAFSLNCTC